MTINDIQAFAQQNLLRNTVLSSINAIGTIGEAYINLINDRNWQFSMEDVVLVKEGDKYRLPANFERFIDGVADNDETKSVRVPDKKQIPQYSDKRNRDTNAVYLSQQKDISGSYFTVLFGTEPNQIHITYKQAPETITTGDQTPLLIPTNFHHILSYDFAINALTTEQPSQFEAAALQMLQQRRAGIYQQLIQYDNDLVKLGQEI